MHIPDERLSQCPKFWTILQRKAARQSQLDVLEADAHTQDARICDYQERISAINTELNAERSRQGYEHLHAEDVRL